MARPLRAPSETLTPVKNGERHPHLNDLPPAQKTPSHIVNLEDDNSEGQNSEDDSGDAEQSSKGPASEVGVMDIDLSTEIAGGDRKENREISPEAGTDQESNEDLMKANSRIIRVSGHIDEITAQLLQEKPTTSRGRTFWTNVSKNPTSTSGNSSSSESEAERSAARLNAVTRPSLRNRNIAGAEPANLEGSQRTATVERESSEDLPLQSAAAGTSPTVRPSTAHSTETAIKLPSRVTRATAKGIPSIWMSTVTPQNISPGKRKRSAETRLSSSSLQRNDVSEGTQATKKHIHAALANRPGGSRPRTLARPSKRYNDMTGAVPSKTQKAAPGPRADPYIPELSPTVKTTVKQPDKGKLQATDGKNHTRSRIRNQKYSEDEVPEEGDMETAEPIQELQRVPGKRQVKPAPTTSSTVTGRVTRANPTGDRALSQSPTHLSTATLAPRVSKTKSAERISAQKAELRRPVVKVASEDPRGPTRIENQATRETDDAEGSSRQRSTVIRAKGQHGTSRQAGRSHPNKKSLPEHRVRQPGGHGVKSTVPARESSNNPGQPPDAEDSEASDLTQSGESVDGDHADEHLSTTERLERITECVNTIRSKRKGSGPEYKAVAGFLNDVRELRSLYTKLAEQEQGTSPYVRLCGELDNQIGVVEGSSSCVLGEIARDTRGNASLKKKKAILRGLYIWVIPDIVVTIRTAVSAHGDGFIPTAEIRRIIKLQSVVIQLGDQKWGSGVRVTEGSREVLNRFRRAVLRHTKELRKDYAKELKERRKARAHRLEVSRQRRIANGQREQEKRMREIKRRRRVIHEQVLSDLARTDPKFSGNWREDDDSSSTQDEFAGNKPSEWPEVELLALVQGLEKFTGKLQWQQLCRSIPHSNNPEQWI
jgi:hypothetical protein